MKQMLVEYARYNLWANENLITLFRSVDDALISQAIVSSFPSIRTTLLHIWDAQSLWIERLNGTSPTEFPSKTFVGTNADVFEAVLKSSMDFIAFVEKNPAPFLKDKITFKTLSYSQVFTQSVREMMLHCMNHSTFHRGQLVMMCRQLDIGPIPPTDYIVFSRELKH